MPELGLLLRLSVDGPDGSQQPVPRYGGQLQDRAIDGVPAEGGIRITHTAGGGRYADGTPYELAAPHYAIADRAYGPLPDDVRMSPRVAPPVFGVGLLEAVPERAILAHADPGDADGDGISGRANRVGSERSRRHGARALRLEGQRADRRAAERRRVQRRHRHHEPDLPGRELLRRPDARAARRSTAASPRSTSASSIA